MLTDHAAAEDVSQECFLRLWRQSARWRPDATVKTWLYRVAHNLCIDALRKRRESAELDPEAPDDRIDPAGELQRRQVAERVEREISALPERQRTALTLAHHMELGNIEAAEVMDISVEALESLLSRARRTLRARLAPEREDLIGGTG